HTMASSSSSSSSPITLRIDGVALVPVTTTPQEMIYGVDPGPHRAVVEKGDRLLVGPQSFGAKMGEAPLVLEVDEEPRAPTPPASPTDTKTNSTVVPSSPTKSSRRTIALGVGAAGIAFLGAGIVFGVLASDRHSTSEGQCTGNACSADGIAAE